ncbi:uncharacterized protein B0I36DRAFT_361037 [Microdochium trichocladiopsis]|uniref:Uncharacterized protein n=1 Tax=Microdochium trichocladiopsis TaxID=1682393 RepID=A0A9P8YD30_9PEZI|nr:uncharacterized protein B0I36DRAFT_361037 [Microdochium trichocladiopsis]KAH7035705.1 hypothetical protein B0I36DRAFT_361037 [Microdochium trichocladiopsis]
MYRVSQLRLSCGPSSDEPHYRRVDELQDHVRKTGTHLMPCIPRYQGHKESCWKLAIDPGLPEGHLQDGTCTYCATVRPAWNKKLADVLGKIEMILDECWGAMQDDFRDPERQCYDDPAAGERRAAEMCASALQAMMLWREEQFYAASEVGGDLFDAGLPSRLSSSPASDEFEQHFQDNHGPTQDRRTEYTSSSSNSMGEPDTTDRSGMPRKLGLLHAERLTTIPLQGDTYKRTSILIRTR